MHLHACELIVPKVVAKVFHVIKRTEDLPHLKQFIHLFCDKNAKINQSLHHFRVVFATVSQLKSSHKGTMNGSAARQRGTESQKSDMKYEASCQKMSMWSAVAGERRVIYSLRC